MCTGCSGRARRWNERDGFCQQCADIYLEVNGGVTKIRQEGNETDSRRQEVTGYLF